MSWHAMFTAIKTDSLVARLDAEIGSWSIFKCFLVVILQQLGL